ncbi:MULTISPECIES: MFS transporter [unclassified Carboxylicivirga]|uniref:MFS transporter n=1 Tax=Carboxylicivirga TaxID=1628153 RepID=UPI003D34BC94
MSHKINTRWLPLFITNFLGVLNDNYLKYLVFYISTTWLLKNQEAMVLMIAQVAFVLPYIVFSPMAGKLARDHSKAKIIQYAKLYEIPIMGVAALGFILNNIIITMLSVFLMGLQSCLFSPAKYGIIRDIGGRKGIPFGTGAMEMLTFFGVLTGTYVAGLTSDLRLIDSVAAYRTPLLCAVLMLLALIGWLTSRKIHPKETVPDEEEPTTLNPIRFFIQSFQWSRQIKGLNTVIFSLATFWAIGSILQLNVVFHCRNTLNLSDAMSSTIMALVAIGIGAGCYVTGVISNKQLKMHLVPIGGLGMLLCVSLIFVLNPATTLFTILIVLTAFFAGMFKIPLNAFIQDRVHGRKLGLILAYNNLTLFTFILLSAGLFGAVETIANSLTVFAAVAAITFTIALLAWWHIPGAGRVKMSS